MFLALGFEAGEHKLVGSDVRGASELPVEVLGFDRDDGVHEAVRLAGVI